MDALLKRGDPAAAPVHAVVTTEQQLFQRGASLPDAKNALASWLPPGPVAVADYPDGAARGHWLSQEQVSAASEFARFLRKPEQLAELAKAGFRTDGGQTAEQRRHRLRAAGRARCRSATTSMRATLANAVTAPARSPAVTIMLDQSMNADEGGKSRLANVDRGTRRAACRRCRRTRVVGLWTFDGVDGTLRGGDRARWRIRSTASRARRR